MSAGLAKSCCFCLKLIAWGSLPLLALACAVEPAEGEQPSRPAEAAEAAELLRLVPTGAPVEALSTLPTTPLGAPSLCGEVADRFATVGGPFGLLASRFGELAPTLMKEEGAAGPEVGLLTSRFAGFVDRIEG